VAFNDKRHGEVSLSSQWAGKANTVGILNLLNGRIADDILRTNDAPRVTGTRNVVRSHESYLIAIDESCQVLIEGGSVLSSPKTSCGIRSITVVNPREPTNEAPAVACEATDVALQLPMATDAETKRGIDRCSQTQGFALLGEIGLAESPSSRLQGCQRNLVGYRC